MKNLFFGGSSEIALKLADKIKNVENIARSKSKLYSKNHVVKNYNKLEVEKILKRINKKFDNMAIFNGSFSGSFLSNFSEKEFDEIFNINFKIPILIAQLAIENKVINNNGSIFFISSVAGESSKTGNAYYSIAKNSLNFAAKILGNEQRKRGVRVNVITLGIVQNKMGQKALNINVNKKKVIIYKNDKFLNKIFNIFNNKNLNLKKIIIK